MTIYQIIATMLIAGILIYLFYDVITHAIKRGGSIKQIIIRILIWIFVFAAIVCINVWINSDWVPDKWQFRNSF